MLWELPRSERTEPFLSNWEKFRPQAGEVEILSRRRSDERGLRALRRIFAAQAGGAGDRRRADQPRPLGKRDRRSRRNQKGHELRLSPQRAQRSEEHRSELQSLMRI